LSCMVIFTTAIGYLLGSGGGGSLWGMAVAVFGTALCAGSAAALNQVMEVDEDRRMERTKKRPLCAGRFGRFGASLLGGSLALVGFGSLWYFSGKLSGLLALATIAVYLVAYTPLKRKSSLCTLVGAVSGALPPVIGWAATAEREIWVAVALFSILFLWQIPHFLAIAWMYREEYEAAGFVMLPRGDSSGVMTAIQALCFSVGLVLICLWLSWLGKVGAGFGVVSGVLNLLFVGSCVVFCVERTLIAARRLFLASIVYLPLVLMSLVFLRARG
jgi:protoheme IX farnesyltransferase